MTRTVHYTAAVLLFLVSSCTDFILSIQIKIIRITGGDVVIGDTDNPDKKEKERKPAA